MILPRQVGVRRRNPIQSRSLKKYCRAAGDFAQLMNALRYDEPSDHISFQPRFLHGDILPHHINPKSAARCALSARQRPGYGWRPADKKVTYDLQGQLGLSVSSETTHAMMKSLPVRGMRDGGRGIDTSH